MIYKLKLLDSNKQEIGEYKGTKIVSEEVLRDCFVIRFPFDFTDDELKDENSLFIQNTKLFIQKLVENNYLKDKMLFVIPKGVEFMKLEEANE